MTTPLETLTDREIDRAESTHDEPGFGSLATEQGHLPLKAMDVRASLTGLAARVTVEQTFVNNLATALEATYVFPLPPRAAVTDFELEVAGRTVKGVLKERGEARRDYDQALAEGKRAAITEEERPDVFTMRVGNVMPGEAAKIRLTLSGALSFADGEATFRFPLVVAPRYIPGTPLEGGDVGAGVARDTDAVPDASRITPPVLLPGYPNPVALAIEVDLDPAGLKIEPPRSSLHTIVTEQRADGAMTVRLEPGERLDRDFILRFAVRSAGVSTSLSVKPDGDGEAGTFALTLVPPTERSGAGAPRDVVFLLDRSGSMSGWAMVAARRAIARMVDTLSPRDRFSFIAFDHSIETPPELSRDVLSDATNRNRFRAIEFLAKLDARGGTEMAAPLTRGADLLAGGDGSREKLLVLVTDGQIGNEGQLLRTLGPKLKGVRVYTLGIDRAVNEGFLSRLASAGGGQFELVESEDRLDDVMDRIHRHIDSPVWTDVELESSGFEIDSSTLVPARLPGLFAHCPLVITGRFRGAPDGSIRVSAKGADGQRASREVAARPTANPALTALWARGQVRELEDRYELRAADELSQEITATSLRFGVLCRFTAFVAVDSEVVNQGGNLHNVTQPVESPDGWDLMDACVDGAPAGAMPAPQCEAEFEDTACDMGVPPAAPRSAKSKLLGALSGLGRAGRRSRRKGKAPRQPVDASDLVDRIERELVALRSRYAAGEVDDAAVALTSFLGSIIDELRGRLGDAELRQRIDEFMRAALIGEIDTATTWSRGCELLDAAVAALRGRRGSFWK